MTDPAKNLHNAASAAIRKHAQLINAPSLEDAALTYAAAKVRETGEQGSEHAALLVESTISSRYVEAVIDARDRIDNVLNREREPCPDGECVHVFDDWPADTVTQRDREMDQCPACGWTESDKVNRP